mgnify:CR=1 FL=1
MSKFVLTRYLYIFDEVAISFISTLLKKQSLHECYYWISELYYSGFESQTWDLLWFVYYDFYYLTNPKFHLFICKKYDLYDFKSMMTVVKNMFRMTANSNVFITRQYCIHVNNIGHIFRGKKPMWLLNYPSKYHALFRYIDKKMYHYAVTSMPDKIEDDLLDSIQLYFKVNDKEMQLLKTQLGNCNYTNKLHIVWAMICFFLFPENSNGNNKVKKSTIYIACSDSEYNEMVGIHKDPIPVSKYGNSQVCKTLEIKRKYAINSKCIGFELMRDVFHIGNDEDNDEDNHDIMEKIIWYHWEFYAYNCPMWKERFDKYNITVDVDNHKILFHDDDELELFYSQYGYCPDEETNDTLNKGLKMDVIGGWSDWYNDIFTDNSIFEFDTNFKFKY